MLVLAAAPGYFFAYPWGDLFPLELTICEKPISPNRSWRNLGVFSFGGLVEQTEAAL
jgi:hypothetical protein